nr:Arm DNA-binding domain-containing protein [uncultured Rikenella sp.]
MPHKFRLHNPAATQTSIFLDVSFRGRRYKKQLGQTIYSADWNETSQRCRVVKRNELAEAINEKIDTWETAVKDTIKHFTPLADTPPQEEFWRQFTSFLTESSDKSPGTFFVDFVEDYGRKVESTHSHPYRWRVARLVKLLREAEETIYALRSTARDSIVYIEGKPSTIRCVDYHDTWLDFSGCFSGENLFEGTIRSRDSLLYVEHVVPKRFLGFLWNTKRVKERRQEIVSRNPHTEIIGAEFITIRK